MPSPSRTITTGLIGGGLALVATVAMLFANQVETRYVAPGGSPSASCTLTAPCTLERAARLSGPGDTISLLPGLYPDSNIDISLAGTQAEPITIIGAGEATILDGGGGTKIGDLDSILSINNSQWVIVKDLVLQNSGGRGLSIYSPRAGATHHIVIDSVIVRHVGQRAVGGSGDDITIKSVTVEYAAEDNVTNGAGGGWAGGISSYSHGDGTPARRWSLTGSIVRYVKGECVIALRVRGWLAEANSFANCYNVYTDKAQDVVWNANTITQERGWGKFGGVGDGYKLANENPQMSPTQYVTNVSITNSDIFGAKDCISYWQDAGSYSVLTITGNDCHSNSGNFSNFNAVGSAYEQPTANTWRANTCTGNCDEYFGDTNDRLSWEFDAPTATSTRTATRTVTPSRTATPRPSLTPTRTATASPTWTATASSTHTATSSPTATSTSTQTSTPTPTPTPTYIVPQSNLGVLVGNWNSTGVNVAKTLGVGLARHTIFLDRWDGTCAECDRLIAAGLKLVLTVRANGGAGTATIFPPDIAEYTLDLRSVLRTYGPWIEVLVVENEENSPLFWASSVPQYHELLAMACTEAKAAGIYCANGGLVYSLVALLTWQSYMDADYTENACSFAWRNFEPDLAGQMCLGEGMPENTADYILEQVTKGETLLAGYEGAGVRFVNFHSYAADYYSIVEMAAYLYHRYALRVMIGEMGERELRPANVVSGLQACSDTSIAVDYCIWFSVDVNQAKALHNADGTLRPTGDVFREWVLEHYDRH